MSAFLPVLLRAALIAGIGALFLCSPWANAQAAALSTLEVGCPWIDGSDAVNKNTGFPDTHATYHIVSVPVNPGTQVHYVVRGAYPRIRYFGFQMYDGFRPGNLIDTLPDAGITPEGGNPPDPNPAVLPDSGGYTNTYEITVRFELPPKAGAPRESNVLYAGKASRKGALTKQLVYRTYLPNPDADRIGSVPLPSVHYVGPRGDIDLEETPEATRCAQIEASNAAITTFPVPGNGTATPKWKPVSGAGQLVFYPNGDINYIRTQTAARYADMVVIRAKAPVTAALPPLVVPQPDTRYWSLCQDQLKNSAVVACLADREMSLDADGYLNVVISKPEKRPPSAKPARGYDWMPHGDADDAAVGFRMMLANPSFVGNYAKAVAQPNKPVETTLGEWAPQISYCDGITFEANASAGGAALMAACKAAYVPWIHRLLPLPPLPTLP